MERVCPFNMSLWLENVKLTRKTTQSHTITHDHVWSQQSISIYHYWHLEEYKDLLWGESKMLCLSYNQKEMSPGTEDMGQWVKCLPCKHEDRSSDLHNLCQKPEMVVHICNPSTEESATRASLGLSGQPAQLNWWDQDQWEILSQNLRWRVTEEDTIHTNL